MPGTIGRMPTTAEQLLSALAPLPFPARLTLTARTARGLADEGVATHVFDRTPPEVPLPSVGECLAAANGAPVDVDWIAGGSTFSRAYATQASTSATSAHRTIASGYRSTAPLWTARAASYRGSSGVMIAPRIPARSSRSSWLLVGLLIVVMKISIHRHRCGGLD